MQKNKIKFVGFLLALFSATLSSFSARAQSFDSSVTPIFTGGGLSSEGWRSTEWQDQWIVGEIGLRVVNMEDQSSVHSGDTYQVSTGIPWRLEYSIDASWLAIANYRFSLLVDLDPSQGERFQVVSPLTAWPNFYGNFDTIAGNGELGEFFPLAYDHTIAQQTMDTGVNQGLNATYSYRILVYDSEGLTLLASQAIHVVVGSGGLPGDVEVYPYVDVNGARAGNTSIVDYFVPGGTETLQDKVDALRIKHARDNKRYRSAIGKIADAELKAKRISRLQADEMKKQASIL